MLLQEYVEQRMPEELLSVLRNAATGTRFVEILAEVIQDLNMQIAHAPLPVEFDAPALMKHHASVRDMVRRREAFLEVYHLLRQDRAVLAINQF